MIKPVVPDELFDPMNSCCHLCGEPGLLIITEYTALKRVTSDCKPWPEGGKLAVCPVCSTAQAVIDDQWRNECHKIYGSYSIYHQSGGEEQAVYSPGAGVPSPRSDYLLSRMSEVVKFPDSGRLLDIGCGNGGFLRSFSKKLPGWRLNGSEYDAKYRAEVERIPGFEELFLGGISAASGQFDVISLIHVLEHIASPRELLREVHSKLKPGGLLVIELPYFVENPFVLSVADHATHFDIAAIRALMADTGFFPHHLTSNWVPKELSIVAAKTPASGRVTSANPVDPVPAVRWLMKVRDQALAVGHSSNNFGIFGTSIAGNWLYAELAPMVKFFVDEDPGREGKMMNGCPILLPRQVLSGSDIYLALPPKIAEGVLGRLRVQPGCYHLPPAGPAH